ncbi:MAG: hypothetical protein Q7K39_04805 [Candidatus Magasanikbacteria bacterium]|nr:hypothetical protein [Candidatus Magasanikbacteria bacterium]
MSVGVPDVRITIIVMLRIFIAFLIHIIPIGKALRQIINRKDLKHNRRFWIISLLAPLIIGLFGLYASWAWYASWAEWLVLGLPLALVVAIAYFIIERGGKRMISKIILIAILFAIFYFGSAYLARYFINNLLPTQQQVD